MKVWNRFKDILAGSEDHETNLIWRAQRGDSAAFDALLRLHEKALRGYIGLRVSASALDDIYQETTIAAWTAIHRFNRKARLRAWLVSIAHHKCVDYYRQNARSGQDVAFDLVGEAVYAPDEFSSIDERDAVRVLFEQLPLEQKQVLEMYYYAELSLAEVAMALDRNANTVKSQFYRAHVALENTLSSQQAAFVAPVSFRKEPAHPR